MINNRSTAELTTLASNGGGLALNAGRHSLEDLMAIASSMQAGAQLILRNTAHLWVEEMSAIAWNGSNTVLFAD